MILSDTYAKDNKKKENEREKNVQTYLINNTNY